MSITKDIYRTYGSYRVTDEGVSGWTLLSMVITKLFRKF